MGSKRSLVLRLATVAIPEDPKEGYVGAEERFIQMRKLKL
jgi:hypothetical protein